MASRDLARAARRLADQQSARLAAIPAVPLFFGTVSATTPDVTVSWRGSDLLAAKVLPSYTPGVGDRVVCALIDNQLTVLG